MLFGFCCVLLSLAFDSGYNSPTSHSGAFFWYLAHIFRCISFVLSYSYRLAEGALWASTTRFFMTYLHRVVTYSLHSLQHNMVRTTGRKSLLLFLRSKFGIFSCILCIQVGRYMWKQRVVSDEQRLNILDIREAPTLECIATETALTVTTTSVSPTLNELYIPYIRDPTSTVHVHFFRALRNSAHG